MRGVAETFASPAGPRWARPVLAVAVLMMGGTGGVSHGHPRERAPSRKSDVTATRLEPLRALEDQLRLETDPRHVVAGDRSTGPDPYTLRPLEGGTSFVGLLRGSAELVLLDADLHVVDRAPAPRAPTGMAFAADGQIFVCGELASEIVRYRVTARSIRRTGAIALSPGHGVRDVAAGPGDLLYAVDQGAGRLLTLRIGRTTAAAGSGQAIVAARSELAIGHGPTRVARVGSLLIVDLLLDHALVIFRTDDQGRPTGEPARIQHDGPIWSFDAVLVAAPAPHPPASRAPSQDLILVAGGVEDHPLDRTIGSFGYIDSFLTVYRIPFGAPGDRAALHAVRVAALNLSELGIITPKVVALEPVESSPPGGGRALVTGYGSSLMATVDWRRFDLEPTVVTRALAPGTTSVVRRDDGALLFADPLLDAWVVASPTSVDTVPIDGSGVGVGGAPAPSRSVEARLGEALFFTTLMAPFNHADGPASRFTCETCHFEGGVDGRTHHTGRGDVRATTKPLRGLLNNRPYFSRALDPDLATMVNNEFRVAGANSGRDPWFAVRVDDFPWLRTLGVTGVALPALSLRRALISFLGGLSHMPNPLTLSATGYDARQRAGAAVFRQRCEGCHEARLVSDEPASRIPFDGWERAIFSEADPLVWGSSEYRQTGVVPYVHERGARVPSLRRVSAKFPYFTNGSARTLDQVIARVRFGAAAFSHDGALESGAGLDAADSAALAAFLDLL